jgi:hypothetical protein
MLTRCSYAAKYKATRPPRCTCDVCWEKWEEKEDVFKRALARVNPAEPTTLVGAGLQSWTPPGAERRES